MGDRLSPLPKTSVPVGGRLTKFSDQWSQITSDTWVLRTVSEGYKIEFTGRPRLSTVPRWTQIPRTEARKQALEDGLQKLLQKQAVRLVDPPPNDPGFYSTLFLVEKKSGGWRPILNLKKFNKVVKPQKFRMETLRSVMQSLGNSMAAQSLFRVEDEDLDPQGPFAISIDLEDAYFHVAIHPDHRKYLRFGYRGKIYEFQVLPFGLSTAPRTFTRIVRVIAIHLKVQGADLYQYLDDWLMLAESVCQSIRFRDLALDWVRRLGFLLNESKSDLVPTLNPTFIGASIDLARRMVCPTKARVKTVTKAARRLLREIPVPKARDWQRFLGYLASLVDLVPDCRAHLRAIQLNLARQWRAASDSPGALVPANPETIRELYWWSNPDNLRVGVSFVQEEPAVTIITDASTSGWGGHLGELTASGTWPPAFARRHINWLELRAVWLTMRKFHKMLGNSVVEVLSDNSTTVAYINKQGGTRSRSLCALALQFWRWCKLRRIRVLATHIAGVRNVLADALSRGSHNHPTEWTLHRSVFQRILVTWETPWIDLFASEKNHQLRVFYSAKPSPTSSGVNALTQNWEALIGYAYPPVALIPRVLSRLIQFPSAKIYLVAPYWPSQTWFRNIKDLLVDWPRSLPVRPDLLHNSVTGMVYPDPAKLKLTVWPLSANPSLRKDFLERLRTSRLKRDDLLLSKFTIVVSPTTTNGAPVERYLPLRPL